jgi:hypothetical protein
MIEAVFLFLILLVAAWAAHQFLPHPIGVVAAVIIGLLALFVLVSAVSDESVRLDAVAPALALWFRRRWAKARGQMFFHNNTFTNADAGQPLSSRPSSIADNKVTRST